MELLMEYGKSFLIGGLLCLIGQILIDRTKLTPTRILTTYVALGVLLGGLGIYEPFAKWAGAGATIPLLGFGNTLAKGVRKSVSEQGIIGVFTGGFTSAAGGICAAIFFGLLVSIIFKSKDKNT